MRLARVAAGLLATLAVGCYVMLVVAGSRIGWVAEVGGTPGGPSEPFHLLGELPWMTVLLSGALVAALLAARRPRHPIPWLLAVGAIGYLGFPAVVAVVAAATLDGTVPSWAPYLAWTGNWTWVLGQAGLFYLLLLFPDGRPLNARWRAVARVAAVYVAVAAGLMMLWPELQAAPGLVSPVAIGRWPGGVQDVLMQVAFVYVLGFLLLQVLMVVCLVLRFVRSAGTERQQMKWMAFGAATFGVVIPAIPLGAPRWILAVPTGVLVAAILVAVTRYRLYEIDRIISRTVSYAVLTAVLAGVYVGCAVGLGAVARAATGGGGGELVVAASTLAVAALFQPLRRHVQAVVDRRFNRAGYDAQRTVEVFAQRLRSEVDLSALVDDLHGTAAAALQPRQVSVWLPSPKVRS